MSTILNNPHDEFMGSLTMRAGSSNAGAITWSDTGGSEGGYLEAREANSWDLAGKYIKAAHVIINGTLGDLLYITVVG
jgi:hypothetical protein